MAYHKHLEAFVNLGILFEQFCNNHSTEFEDWSAELATVLKTAALKNSWYTQDHLLFGLGHWAKVLKKDQLEHWVSSYQIEQNTDTSKTIAIIMAGNIPLVGFHDFLSVLLSGHEVVVKLSSNDTVLLPFVKKFLVHHDPTLQNKIEFTEDQLQAFDAVIATGSTNTSRYFEYYFGKYPNIIRKNRNSIAVLNGQESKEELEELSEDIFRYFGLGCRSVSKIFVPEGYDFELFFNTVYKWKHLLEHHKYVNNYDYNKAVYLMSELKILDNGFLILKEDDSYASPIATLFFEYYSDALALKERLHSDADQIQCVVSKNFMDDEIAFGQTQTPKLTDYADGVDTMKFLSELG